ncbi:MAG TPA: sigma-70 family RNA polymerase sigma factor [Actinomycetota bacterium]|jgi:RNA polymerase sigma-70 factor (ECF subfamily)
MDDVSLMARASAGDERAFEALVHRYTQAMWRLARSLLDDNFEAEEAVQDSFLKAHRGLRSFRGDAAVGTWLLSICYRTSIDRLRARRSPAVSLDTVSSIGAEPDLELRLALKTTIASLPEEQRAAFILVHVLGYSRQEAAEVIGVPASTLRDRLVRAKERLAGMQELTEAVEER